MQMTPDEVFQGALTILVATQPVPGKRWYRVENTLGLSALQDGRLRRVEFWYLTDEAAAESGLKN